MAFDATLLTAVLDEIRTKAAAARIDKIHQPSRVFCCKGEDEGVISGAAA